MFYRLFVRVPTYLLESNLYIWKHVYISYSSDFNRHLLFTKQFRPRSSARHENTSIVSDIRRFERSDFKGSRAAQSEIAFEITKNSTDFFPFPSKSPKVESTTNPFMHSFLRCPPSYLTAESEPFSSDRVRPPLHPSDTLTIYAVISVLPSVLPHCILWYGFHLILFSPCDHLCSAFVFLRVTSPLHPPPPLTTHAVTCAPILTRFFAYMQCQFSYS